MDTIFLNCTQNIKKQERYIRFFVLCFFFCEMHCFSHAFVVYVVFFFWLTESSICIGRDISVTLFTEKRSARGRCFFFVGEKERTRSQCDLIMSMIKVYMGVYVCVCVWFRWGHIWVLRARI